MVEFILSLFYFIIFCVLINKISLFKDSIIPNNWFIVVFGIKVIVSILLTLIYTYYYKNRDTADIFKYFDDSLAMFEALKTEPLDYLKMLFGIDNDHTYFTTKYYQYMNHWSRPYSSDLISDSHLIIRFNAFVRLFSFGHIQVHNVFINFVSLVGLTLLFKVFKAFLLKKEKALFYLVFLVPSVLFWGSGLLKESIILFGLGLILYSIFNIRIQFRFIYLLTITFGAILIIYTKFYILIALSIPILGYIINSYFKLKKIRIGYLTATLLFIAVCYIASIVNSQLDIIFQITNKQQSFSRFIAAVPTNSGFLIPELKDGYSIILNSPNALLNTFIRPFFWECNSLFVWLSLIENFFVISFMVLVIFLKKEMNNIQRNIFYFNLIFVLGLFLLIGLTTPVFGSIIRYKIPGLILLLISLLLLLDLEKIKVKHPILNKIL